MYFCDLFAGDDGRIWVFRYVAADKRDDVAPLPDRPEHPLLTWREPSTFDVFEPDGTFLWSVVVPELLEPLVFRGTTCLEGSSRACVGSGRNSVFGDSVRNTASIRGT